MPRGYSQEFQISFEEVPPVLCKCPDFPPGCILAFTVVYPDGKPAEGVNVTVSTTFFGACGPCFKTKVTGSDGCATFWNTDFLPCLESPEYCVTAETPDKKWKAEARVPKGEWQLTLQSVTAPPVPSWIFWVLIGLLVFAAIRPRVPRRREEK